MHSYKSFSATIGVLLTSTLLAGCAVSGAAFKHIEANSS